MARAVAAMHGISPLLSHSLRWQGPVGWTRFLDQQRTHTAARHTRVHEVLTSIGQKAREAGVTVTPLKGAALHELGLYAPGDRPMADIDLLVRPADAQRMSALLASSGFRQTGETWKERVFTAIDELAPAEFGEHSNNSLKIELHERICEKLPWRMTDVSEFIYPLQPCPGLNAYPSNGALMRHLLLHAAGSMAFQGLRMLHLHDIALLAGRMSESDWNELAGSRSGVGMWWAFPPLELMSRYYQSRVPTSLLAALYDDCSRLLRALARRKSLIDVSYSYLWVKAFPGIEWSQTIPELLAYAASRVRPNAKHLAQRQHAVTTQTWAKQQGWSRMSQGRRILRWLTSRQARPATLHAISAAFAQAQ
ncbi:MAG: nucleotidyltransferase family protein [Pseudomonadota bacterium]|nr:nucleotidyltransferase family protein [Pseudomonadota bacterium]